MGNEARVTKSQAKGSAIFTATLNPSAAQWSVIVHAKQTRRPTQLLPAYYAATVKGLGDAVLSAIFTVVLPREVGCWQPVNTHLMANRHLSRWSV
jgi:hypothetical protein